MMAGLANIIDWNYDTVAETNEPWSQFPSSGVSIAGIVNWRTDGYNGLCIAGFLNMGKEDNSISLAGLANSSNSLDGGQLSLILNSVDEKLRGFQVSSYNHADNGKGLQIGFITKVSQTFTGFRMAGITNVTGESNKGVSMAGLHNYTEESHSGIELSLFNKSNRTKGLQFGLMNDSKDLEGLQIGLFNFSGGKLRMPLVNWF